MVIRLYHEKRKKMKTSKIIATLLVLAGYSSFAQDQPESEQAGRSQALNIFFDCGQCDMEYFKTQLTAVNYVNDSHDADVHILVSSMPTGSGGEEYNIRLQGRGQYSFMTDTVYATMPEYYSTEETRLELLGKIKLGLVPFLLKTPYGDKLSLSIDEIPLPVEEKDPWRSWVFDISGSGSLSRQKYYESYNLMGNLYLSKITPAIKIESTNYFGYNESSYSYPDSDTITTYKMDQRDFYSQNLFVKSLGKRWGFGGFASFCKSEYSNLDFQMIAGPAAEFNIFDYDEAATRQCRILYSLNYEHSNYHDLTIYNKMAEDLFRQDLSINFTYFEPWGTLSAIATGSSYLDDLSQYSVGASAMASVRIFKGLSLNISGGASYSQNQRSLMPAPDDPRDIVTGQWQMEEGLGYSINLGISYRFGSKNNNAVNARFGY
jgi:hypothetical protein